MRRWLRSNRFGLVAVAVLLPATVAITFATQFSSYFSGRPSVPLAVASGATAEFARADWTLVDSRRIAGTSDEGAEIGLPTGSDLVVVTVRVSPGDGEAPGCLMQLDELAGSSVIRSWGESTTDPIDYTPAEDTRSYCDSDAVAPYTLEAAFVMASDAGDDLAFAVSVDRELPRYLSFRL